MTIIAVFGKKYSGKTTIADYIIKNYEFIKYSIANPMKRVCKEIFMFKDKQMWGIDKDVVDERYGVTPRKILQVFGTELFQYDIYKHIPELAEKIPPRKIWIKRFKLWYEKEKNKSYERIRSLEDMEYGFSSTCDVNIVIDDGRFLHEDEELKMMGGFIIKVERDLIDRDNILKDEILITDTTFSVVPHASELEVDKIKPDFDIQNFGGFDELYKNIDEIMSILGKKKI